VLKRAIENGFEILKAGGRMCIITFHSLEDRIVKETYQKYIRGCTCPKEFPVCICGFKETARLPVRKPIAASTAELEENPRSRSAKLRVIEKLSIS